MLSYTPKGEDFEFFLGPNEKLIMIGDSCEDISYIRDKFSEWRVNIGEVKTAHKECTCGVKNIPEDIFNYFLNIKKHEFGVKTEQEAFERLRLKKKIKTRQAKKYVGQFCYLDIENIMPQRAQELAINQIMLDRDNMFNNSGYRFDGINCYNIALNGIGTMIAQRHITPFEMGRILRPPICESIPPKDIRPGDILVYYRSDAHNQSAIDGHLNSGYSIDEVYAHVNQFYPLHASVFVNKEFVFEKKGGDVNFPVQFAREVESRRLNSKVQETNVVTIGYRCKTESQIREVAKKYPQLLDLFDEVIEYEKCFENFYSYADIDIQKKARDWIKDSGYFFILHNLILDELKNYKTFDENGFHVGYKPGSEEEVILLELLERKIHNMIEDRLGRSHDGPEQFYQDGAFLWESS